MPKASKTAFATRGTAFKPSLSACVYGSGVSVQGSGFQMQVVGRGQGTAFRPSLSAWVHGLGFMIQGSALGVQVSGRRDQG